jgi:hypothetical protein
MVFSLFSARVNFSARLMKDHFNEWAFPRQILLAIVGELLRQVHFQGGVGLRG